MCKTHQKETTLCMTIRVNFPNSQGSFNSLYDLWLKFWFHIYINIYGTWGKLLYNGSQRKQQHARAKFSFNYKSATLKEVTDLMLGFNVPLILQVCQLNTILHNWRHWCGACKKKQTCTNIYSVSRATLSNRREEEKRRACCQNKLLINELRE